jgi:hypothetical protein
MLSAMALHAHLNEIFVAVAAALVLAAILVFVKTREHETEEQREQNRREYLTEAGRIIDGTLLGIDDPDGERPRYEDGPHALYYSYEISGVVYESSQDVKLLQQFVRPGDCRLGSPLSVRYDPRNHANSIIVAEAWSGLRKSSLRRTTREAERRNGMGSSPLNN